MRVGENNTFWVNNNAATAYGAQTAPGGGVADDVHEGGAERCRRSVE